ncbi:Uncharacterised protein [Serratia ficaria]|uniref:hypothetical protein n=1 Tax=Enterobacterales TaxID=91347 RepID=UPI000F7E8071|nr:MULTISPECIES: hypothetical protein [Enterobacterales]RSV87656.1 hypothetical protein EGH55_20715 [Klebsiella aerogenes]CAI1970570.1 Uncharacterised protein [Serratia ficaria]
MSISTAADLSPDPAAAIFPLAVAAPFVERQHLTASAGELSTTVEFAAGQGAYPGADGPLPFLSLHISTRYFMATFAWPVFAELRRLLRALRDGDRTRSYQGWHVSLHVPKSGDIGLLLPNFRLPPPGTFATIKVDLLNPRDSPAMVAALGDLAALYGDLWPPPRCGLVETLHF